MLISILISSASLFCIILLFGLRFYGVRELKTEEIYKGAVYSKPFWEEFITFLQPVIRIIVLKIFMFANISLRRMKKIKFKKYTKKFSDYIHGRHFLKKKECDGYWGEINGNSNKDKDLPG